MENITQNKAKCLTFAQRNKTLRAIKVAYGLDLIDIMHEHGDDLDGYLLKMADELFVELD